jgi:hypothetical protein
MSRAVLIACLPWLALLLAAVAVAFGLFRLSGSRVRFRRLRRLHRDQVGGVQSLSFVLTLPLFIAVMMFIVQVSQLMIGTVCVHYAAFAAARSAIVWIPAWVDAEGPNCISAYRRDPDAPDQRAPVLDPESPAYGPADGGLTYVVEPGFSPKYYRILGAAAMACAPISPSHDYGIPLAGNPQVATDALTSAYLAMVPDAAANGRIPQRLANKMAYAIDNTEVEIRFYHKNSEPPLEVTYFLPPDIAEFRFNEVGWQDPLTVTVKHNLALLPGPGRLLIGLVGSPSTGDRVSTRTYDKGAVYVYPLRASATLGNEGEKSILQQRYHAVY